MTLLGTTRRRALGSGFVVVLAAVTALVASLLTPVSPATAAVSETTATTQVATDLSSTNVAGAGALATDIAKTADLSLFRPGNIISDEVFFDKNTMTEAQIQAFLQAQVPSCRSGYTCLKDWYDTSRTTSADAMCGAYSGGVRERASRIIYKVAQACGINPQVILATLQKEQGLVTHVWPSTWRYTIAMGQGCPDTAACDTRYYGFFNQVFGAAWQFKRYANPAGTSQYFTWYAPGKTWNVRWHPNASCGSSPVYIENQATANLYYYTPYQPNAAAIRAYSGEGDNCSSYGNRNFFRYFTDWFGSTQGVPGAAFVTLESSNHVTALGSDGTIWAYPFTGKGGWGTRKAVATKAEGVETLLSPGDFDGDGQRDLIGVDNTGKAYLWRGDGASAYQPPSSVLVDWKDAVLITDAGDFSGDGVPDVFTTTNTGALLLWRGTGTGGFRQPIQVGSGWGTMDLVSGGADVSGDRIPDLLARDTSGRLWLYAGNGSGGFLPRVQIGHGWSAMERIFVPGNFIGTSHPDIVAMTSSGQLRLYAGVGGGKVAFSHVIGSGWHTMTASLGNRPASDVRRTHQPGAGDIDADGFRDVLAVASSGELRVYGGNGRGSWSGEPWVIASGLRASDRLVTLGDFTGDGEPDIGRIDAAGLFFLRPSRGASDFDTELQIGHGWSALTNVVGGLDVDGDGALDVLATDVSGQLLLFRGNGRGGWLSGPAVAVGTGWLAVDRVFTAGDFDGDGQGDLVARRADDHSLWLYPLNGRGSFLTPTRIGANWGGMKTLFSPGQFDGSAGPDVIALAEDGKMYLYRGSGKGSWTGDRSQIGHGWSSMTWVG